MDDHDGSNMVACPFVLLGAGFSKAIGDAMPVMSPLAPKVLERLELRPDTLDHFAGDLEQWRQLAVEIPTFRNTYRIPANEVGRSQYVPQRARRAAEASYFLGNEGLCNGSGAFDREWAVGRWDED